MKKIIAITIIKAKYKYPILVLSLILFIPSNANIITNKILVIISTENNVKLFINAYKLINIIVNDNILINIFNK
jgi:hypothetical protein